MWQPKDSTNSDLSKEDKHQVDTNVDSGFLSGNLMSSDFSYDSDNEDPVQDDKVAPEPAKATDSGLDLGLVSNLKDLSLKEGTILENLDSGVIEEFQSEEWSSEDLEDQTEGKLENWEVYYTQDNDGDTQLHVSIIQGFEEAAYYLINIAPHPCLFNILNDDSQAALHVAVLTRQWAIARRLILVGADPTVRNLQGNTPLHLSCDRGDINCAKALSFPLLASEHKIYENAKHLPQLPQNLEQRNYEGKTCLHIAAMKGHLKIVQYLVYIGADITAQEGLGGLTPMQLAIQHNRQDVFVFLAKHCRPDQLEAKNYAGLTAVEVAERYGKTEYADMLVKLGAKPSVPPAVYSDEESDDEDMDDIDEMYKTPLAHLNLLHQPVSISA